MESQYLCKMIIYAMLLPNAVVIWIFLLSLSINVEDLATTTLIFTTDTHKIVIIFKIRGRMHYKKISIYKRFPFVF